MTRTTDNIKLVQPLSADFIAEPSLQFNYGQSLVDPRHGLELFGPFDAQLPSRPATIPYAVIGTEDGVASVAQFVASMQGATISIDSPDDSALWPPFPGFEAAYRSSLSLQPVYSHILKREAIERASLESDPNARAHKVASLYMQGINIVAKRDESIAVVLCIEPDFVWQRCRPESTVMQGIGRRISKDERAMRSGGQTDIFESWDPEQYEFSTDFRRQLKARAMAVGVTTQLIRESTLRLVDLDTPEERGLTPLSDRMWNLSTGIYYKSGGKPWRLNTAREGVCYIGVSFKKTSADKRSRTACCAAQMFLDTGDGIVFMGETGRWYSPERHQCHLSRDAAKRLLTGVLETYQELEGKHLKEIFLHYRSSINDEEIAGYRSACPDGATLVGIRVRTDRQGGLRLHRQGKMPVVRGTVLPLASRMAYLWSSGYKPSIGTYDGWEVPVPLRIDIQHGDGDILQVASDILGLTKLNYNACKIGDAEPATIAFSNDVGEILVSNPHVKSPRPNFRYYI